MQLSKMQLGWCSCRVALSRSVIRWGGTSGMPRSFWHAFSKSLVAVSISSPVTWHNVSWAIDLAMRCSAACSISDVGRGRLCQLDSCSTSWWQAVGCFDTSRGSPTLVIPAVSCCQCISAQIEHNSDRCHGEMYFDIVLVYCHQTRKQKTPTPNRKPKTQQRRQRGEGEAIQRVARVARYDRPVMGLPCWPFFFLSLKIKIKKGAWAMCTGVTSRGSPTLVTSATIALLKPILWYFCLCGTSWGAESSRWRGCGEVC